jgi:hypothetical protein
MILRRSKRKSVPTTNREEKDAPFTAYGSKIIKKIAQTAQKTTLKPLTINSLLKLIELDKNNSSEQSKRIVLPETG